MGGTDLYLAQPISDKLPPATDENKYRDPQPDNMQRVKDLGTLSPKMEGSIKFFLAGTRKLCGRGGRKSVKPEMMVDTKNQDLLITTGLAHI